MAASKVTAKFKINGCIALVQTFLGALDEKSYGYKTSFNVAHPRELFIFCILIVMFNVQLFIPK